LKTSAQKIYERIKNDTTRPLLTDNMNIETIQNMLNIREKNYKLAHYTVLTDNRSADEIVNEILGK
jgi:shikimate kinase